MTRPVWLPPSLLLDVHERQLEVHGGASGLRDEGLFESALNRPLNAYAYGVEDLCELAALYAAGLVKNHPFVDGNKRTAAVAAELFLVVNGLRLTASDEELVGAILSLASSKADESDFATWLRESTEPVGPEA